MSELLAVQNFCPQQHRTDRYDERHNRYYAVSFAGRRLAYASLYNLDARYLEENHLNHPQVKTAVDLQHILRMIPTPMYRAEKNIIRITKQNTKLGADTESLELNDYVDTIATAAYKKVDEQTTEANQLISSFGEPPKLRIDPIGGVGLSFHFGELVRDSTCYTRLQEVVGYDKEKGVLVRVTTDNEQEYTFGLLEHRFYHICVDPTELT